mgnify:CR=1 FL=1
MITEIQNRMQDIKTKKVFPKLQERREKMRQLNLNSKPFRIAVYEKCSKIQELRFITRFAAQSYLDKNCLKKGNEYFHKSAKGRLDMSIEYQLK